MLKEEEIRTFIEGTTNYFETAAQQAASVGSPYLVTDGKPGAYEYTGMIGISGARKGIVYFTAPRGMLTVLLMRMQEDNQPLYVSVGYDASHDRLYVITVHWLDPRKWEDPWQRRRRRP